MIKNTQQVQCCFCGNMIVVIASDPIMLTVHIDGDEEQQLFCHYRCLKRAADPSVPLYPFDT